VAVEFLSELWARELEKRLNSDIDFTRAIEGQRATIQNVVQGTNHERRYWLRVADGAVALGVGDVDDPDAKVTQDYETAVGLATSRVNPVTAFMTGKIRIEGGLGPLMGLQHALGMLPRVLEQMNVAY
jgi:putative sterol carrier protein